jgi:hypothetical protein
VHWVAWIDQERNFRGTRNQFPEHFYLFPEEIPGHHGRKAGYIAAWTRQALHEAGAHGIGYSHGYGCLRHGANEQIGL